MNSPDLITTSGRESMTVAERCDLLAADTIQLQAGDINPNYRKDSGEGFYVWSKRDWTVNGSTCHAFNQMIGWVKNEAHLAPKRAAGASTKWLSAAECAILAWRRGGHDEYRRVRDEQRKRGLR